MKQKPDTARLRSSRRAGGELLERWEDKLVDETERQSRIDAARGRPPRRQTDPMDKYRNAIEGSRGLPAATGHMSAEAAPVGPPQFVKSNGPEGQA